MHARSKGVTRWLPGLASFKGYQRQWFSRDMTAGLSVAAIALPVGIAYASLAGVPPVVGIYSAIFPLLAYALFGSSRQLMTGPDAATCIMVAASLAPLANGNSDQYLAMMVVLTLMTGALFMLAGIGRMGFIANFLSQPVLTGYLNGIALIIIVGQLPKFFGYQSAGGGIGEQLPEFFIQVTNADPVTTILAVSLLILLLMVRRFVPLVPSAMVVVVVGIVAVMGLQLEQRGVAVLGEIPGGLPSAHWAIFDIEIYRELFRDAAGLVLISFTSGVLTAKSFASRNRYQIAPNQELIAFGACNLASGLAQGFPVTGADSRTAVNNAMGGKTQLVGIVAAIAMLLILFFATGPLASVPIAGLAAVIMVSAVGLFDLDSLRVLYRMSSKEFAVSVITTLGVLILGVLDGVLVAVVLSLVWLLSVGAKPKDSVLGQKEGVKGYHDINDFPGAVTCPGLLLYRFDSNLLFFNADYFCERVRYLIAKAKQPVHWVVVDASPVNIIDGTALLKYRELREQLASEGIVLAHAQAKRNLRRHFHSNWFVEAKEKYSAYEFDTIQQAVAAFQAQQEAHSVTDNTD
ncbi:sulfate permease [Corallincola luteus]|uniref:Sulfate permease n=1 Tax=Corallincola luteus TaxID=1775177 RepID=A0ABY2AQ95_9GAMM|nr:sulfate permease [Corallincola luteus]TCI05146.1 sulfate permease [Corallincola luteus]